MFRKIKDSASFFSMPMENDIGDIVDYTNRLFDFALETDASDIHIEPSKGFIMIRFRQSGDFLFVDKISHEEYAKLLSRIKILANMRIDEKHKPQDGKISFASEKIGGELVDIRVSIMPIVDGEKIVMRILRQNTDMRSRNSISFP